MYSILVVGAGYIGKEIIRTYIEKKQKVFGIAKSAETGKEIERLGATAILADLRKPETIGKIPSAHFVVIALAPGERSDQAYRETYVEAVQNFLSAIKGNPRPFLILYLSSTRVWEKPDAGWIDEGEEATPVSEQARILLEAEKQILNCGYPSLVFRLSGIYGPGRNRMASLLSGKVRKAGPDSYLNMIHRDDVVGAMAALFKSGIEGEVYTGVDESPVLESEVYQWIAEETEFVMPKGLFTKGAIGGKRLLNNKLKSLGYQFRYPEFRAGYRKILELHESGNLS